LSVSEDQGLPIRSPGTEHGDGVGQEPVGGNGVPAYPELPDQGDDQLEPNVRTELTRAETGPGQ
jgi:hypothetical protein